MEGPVKKILLLLILGVLGYVSYLATREKPGQGVKADTGRRQSQPVIAALAVYRDNHGAYPGDLDELSNEVAVIVPRNVDDHPLLYSRTSAGYELTFSYANPLPVHCTYTPATKWQCRYLTKG